MKMNLFTCRSVYSEDPSRAVLLLEPGRIPTTCYYVKGRLPEGIPVRSYVSTGAPPKDLKIEEGTWVIIVRHASRRWLGELLKHRDKFTKVTYVKDDDISAVFAANELPWHYALWTGWRYLRTKNLLSKVVSDIAVSTQELADRYEESKPQIWEPHYIEATAQGEEPLVYFYHATLTHAREIKWLVPIVRRVQKALPNAWFEIIGDGSVARMFKGIPRVRVVHSMNWPNYQAYIRSIRHDVGLAPLMDTSFNRARSHTKLYQITGAGAAGIYSDVLPYADKIINGQTGILCGNRRYLWVRAIIALLKDQPRRNFLYDNARIWCHKRQGNFLKNDVTA